MSIPVGDFNFYASWHEEKTTTDGHDLYAYSNSGDGADGDTATVEDNIIEESDSSTSVSSNTAKKKMTASGISGPLGDTGLSFALNFSDMADGSNPWDFSVAKNLGGGVSLAFEHGNADSDEDDEAQSLVRLKIDF